jgi:Fe-S-cluster containining protein
MASGKSKKSNRDAQADPSRSFAVAGGFTRSDGSVRSTVPTPPAPSAPSASPVARRESLDDFHCTRCGVCCTGEGFVNLGPDECARAAEFLGLPLQEFVDQYTRHEPGYERWLIDGKGPDLPCVFLERDAGGLAGCRIQGDAKPVQCRTFPMKWRIRGFETWCGAFAKKDTTE